MLFRSWTFSLRPGLKWDDGSPLTTDDVRYSIERLFDDKFIGVVSTDVMCLLSTCSTGLPDYTGPASGLQLPSIEVVDDATIRFTLTRPYALFTSVLALPAMAPIQRDRAINLAARGRSYGDNPASSGPFVLKQGGKGGSVTLVRNKKDRKSTRLNSSH